MRLHRHCLLLLFMLPYLLIMRICLRVLQKVTKSELSIRVPKIKYEATVNASLSKMYARFFGLFHACLSFTYKTPWAVVVLFQSINRLIGKL
jgi:hypothetical protein